MGESHSNNGPGDERPCLPAMIGYNQHNSGYNKLFTQVHHQGKCVLDNIFCVVLRKDLLEIFRDSFSIDNLM